MWNSLHSVSRIEIAVLESMSREKWGVKTHATWSELDEENCSREMNFLLLGIKSCKVELLSNFIVSDGGKRR